MGIDASIPLQVQQVSPFQSLNQSTQALSSLANLQQAQQNVQYNGQILDERKKFAAAMQDPNSSFKNPDGTIDYGKMTQWTATNTPLIGSQHGSEIMQFAQHVNQYKSTLSNMADSDMQRTNAVLHSFMGPNGQPIADPKSMVNQLNAVKRTLSGPGASYVDMATKAIENSGGNPQALQGLLGQLSRDTTPASTQTSQLQGATSMVNNGAATLPYAANGEYGQAPGTLTGTPGIPNQVGPEGREAIGTNSVTGGPTVVHRDANGSITGITNPPTEGVYVPQPGDQEAKPVLAAEREVARSAFAQAGTQHENNRIVLSNIDHVAATGSSGQAMRNIASAMGLNVGPGVDSATAYDMVGKGLERSALQAAQGMGLQTNAGLDAQIRANGSLHYTPQAIKEITKLNDALTTGSQSYQPGLERAIAANPSAGVFAKRQFDQAWGANFDPTIFRYYNAIKSGDKSEQDAIVKQLGGKNSNAYKAMMQKAQNLQQLSNTGSIQ